METHVRAIRDQMLTRVFAALRGSLTSILLGILVGVLSSFNSMPHIVKEAVGFAVLPGAILILAALLRGAIKRENIVTSNSIWACLSFGLYSLVFFLSFSFTQMANS